MKAHILTVLSVTFLLAATPASASLALPPDPPAGWETSQTPGFDPSVESVLVDAARNRVLGFTAESARPVWEKWGPGATDVLFRLLETPVWNGFDHSIVSLLFAGPFPETRARIEKELYQIAEGPDLSREAMNCLNVLLLRFPRTPDSLPVLMRLSKSPHPDVVERAIFHFSLIRTEESLAAARDALERLPEERRTRALVQIDHGYAQIRAHEPMAQAPSSQLARPMPKGGFKKPARKALRDLQARFLKSSKQNGDPAMDALVKLAQQSRGKQIVQFLADTASNPELHAEMRQKALFALGRVGTKESVAAWKSLRDAARAQPGAPQPRPAYTHAQRMYEAAIFALCIIPGTVNPYHQLSNPGAWVSTDYTRGAVLLGDVDVQLLRYGHEWLPVEKEYLPVP
ncbi:MAG TPA: hypothetical protein VMZ06_18045 [Candidatus Bathyarchaeia archaeon]|nr:hypothetical protein [Candidatus Bathyarchaeia archaeon]